MDRWLADANAVTTNAAVQLLGAVANERSEQVVGVLRAHDDRGEVWRDRAAYVVRFSNVHTRRDLFEMLVDLVTRDAFVASNDHDVWLYGHELPVEQPYWAAELMELLLERANVRAQKLGERHALYGGSPIEHEHSPMEYVTQLGESSPEMLLTASLPFIMVVIDSDIDRDEDIEERLPSDRVWPYRLSREAYTFSDTLLASTRIAIGRLASEQPDVFRVWANQLRQRRDDTSQYLLYYGLLGNPSEFSDFAAEVLTEGDYRFRSEEEGDGFWIPHQLLSAIAPHLTAARVREWKRPLLGLRRRMNVCRSARRPVAWLSFGSCRDSRVATSDKVRAGVCKSLSGSSHRIGLSGLGE